ncbi:MAG: hypothetical protein MK212_02870 [Saprospiraceae bacterium]|nr:hypothetical protein [Saprospiraceae bacterium]
MNSTIVKIGLCLATGFFMAACSKVNDLVEEQDSVAATELLMSETEEAADENVDAVTHHRKGFSLENLENRLPEGATITTSGEDYPQTITIDFGEMDDDTNQGGCMNRRGKRLSGTILIEITDDMSNPGASRTVTFQDFYVGDRQLLGQKVETNITNISDEIAEFTVVFSMESNIEMIHPDGYSRTREASGTRTWISGFDTEDISDDVFMLDGTATMTCSSGNTSTREIIDPLLVDRSCEHIMQGVVAMTRGDKTDTLDFGDGICDNLATMTRDGETEEVNLDELRRHKPRGKRK